ncbi:hypothetical protein GDO81_004501 [Engystomops pustulosus]|uniref:TNFR-Cys domain-containing protein n=1 Tax=Engystomops pustulosus TaxID=76066 RepID=A0AAV6ZWH6_ENGPU|nr:hypothetical protein GDO81_004501 [Engystomops pustulosus]
MKLRGQAVLLVLLIGYVALGHSSLERQVERQETHKILNKQSPCPRDEYYVEQHCCKLCNEGTYAKADCDVNHGNPECKGCTEGVSYMDKKNGYHECLNCLICDDVLGQNLTEACTVFKNTVCKCKENYFCADTETSPSDGCTKCQECTKWV